MSESPKKTRRPRGPGKTINERIVIATDRMLIGWLREGVVRYSGQLDKDQKPIMVKAELSAAHMQCVLKRLAQIGAAHRGYDRHKSAADLMTAAREKFAAQKRELRLTEAAE